MNEKDFFDKSLRLATEFSRYIVEHPEAKIPPDAQVVFEVEDSPEFTKKVHELARAQHEDGQTVVLVKIKKFPAPRVCLLKNPILEVTSNI